MAAEKEVERSEVQAVLVTSVQHWEPSNRVSAGPPQLALGFIAMTVPRGF